MQEERPRADDPACPWPCWPRSTDHELGFGVGIAQGDATLGQIDFEGRFDYAAIGTEVNLAARLCAEAKPGEILISQRVFAAVEDLVEAEPFGDLQVKGLTRPVKAHNVRLLREGSPAGGVQ